MQVESCSLFEHRQVSTEISRLQKNVQHVSSQENDVTSIRSYLIVTYEVSPKFNCCKMEYLLILRFKGPLRFSMFRTRLSRKLAWPCVFLNGLRDFSCRAPFWRPCTFACVPARFFQSVFVAPLQHGHSSRGGSACMFLRMDGQCFWFCHLRVIAFSSRAKHMLQILVVVQAVL